MPNQVNLDNLYMDLARRIASMSHARRLKVGAVVVKGTNIISYGWNGTPSGEDNNCEIENADGTLTTKDSVLHSEWNCTQKLREVNEDGKLDGATLYCTTSPCSKCTDLICESKIRRVVYDTVYRDTSGIENLKSRGIIVDKISEEKMMICEQVEHVALHEDFITRVTPVKSKEERDLAFAHEFLLMKDALKKIAFDQMLKSEMIALAKETYSSINED